MLEDKIYKYGIFIFIIIIFIIGGLLIFDSKEETNVVEQIVVKTESIKLKVAEKSQIQINSNVDVKYKSENSNIALVDANGYIYAVNIGNTKIEVIYKEKVYAYINVHVYKEETPLEVIEIKLESSNDGKYLKKGDSLLINIDFNRVLSDKVDVLINEEKLDYTFVSNQTKIVVSKKIQNEEKLDLKVMSGLKTIYTYKLPTIDNEPPTCKLERNGNNIIITGNDNNEVAGYAINKNKDYTYSSITTKGYDSSGIWYGSVIDGAGNTGECSINLEKKIDPTDIIIIGDSRMYNLCAYSWYKTENGNCIAKSSMGYKWLIDTAIPKTNEILKNDKEYYITTNLGVNDLYNIDKYISKYKQLATNDWKDYDIFVISVNPTSGKYETRNAEIDSFNSRIKAELSSHDNIIYCNTIDLLRSEGFVSNDGLHYTQETSKKIYNLIKQCIYEYYN